MTDVELTKDERAYFDSQGEKPIPGDVSEAENEEEIESEADETDEGDEGETEGTEKPEADAEKPPKGRPPKGFVPLRKLMAAEERAKEAHEKLTRADERLKILFETQTQRQTQQEAAPPDPKTDPIAALEWQQQQIARQQEFVRQQEAQRQEQAQIEQIDNAYRRSFNDFAAEQKDAPAAYQHFTQGLASYFEAMGVPPAEVEQRIMFEERRLAFQAMQRGANPAELIYKLAGQFGYQPKADANEASEAAKKADADIERRQRAAGASRSMSNTGGERGTAPTLQEIANMSDEEFAELRERMGEKKFNKMLGG